MTQFIQIAATGDIVYALDDIGRVWMYDQDDCEWFKLSKARDDDDEGASLPQGLPQTGNQPHG